MAPQLFSPLLAQSLNLDYAHHPMFLSYLPAQDLPHSRQQAIQRLRMLVNTWHETGLWSIYNLVILQAQRSPEDSLIDLLPELPEHIAHRCLHLLVPENALESTLQALQNPIRKRQQTDPDLYIPVTPQPENDTLYGWVRQHRISVWAPEAYSLYHGYCDQRMQWDTPSQVKHQLMDWVFQDESVSQGYGATYANVFSGPTKQAPRAPLPKAEAKTFARPQKHNLDPSHTSA